MDLIKTLNINIWEREFSLSVEYDCYKDESVTAGQILALKEFAAHNDWITNSKSYVEEFCRNQVMEDAQNEKKDNVFSYVKPEYIFVKHENDHPRVALMCKYRYDVEHGLAVVFSADGTINVGSQDIIM